MPTNRQRTLKQTMAELLPLIRTDLRRLKSRISEDRWREAERKDAIALAKHYSGRHNQKTHGRRYSAGGDLVSGLGSQGKDKTGTKPGGGSSGGTPSAGGGKLDKLFNDAPPDQGSFTNYLTQKVMSGEMSLAEAQKLNARYVKGERPGGKKPEPSKAKPVDSVSSAAQARAALERATTKGEINKILQVDNPSKLKADISTGASLTPRATKTINGGVNDFNKLVSRDVAGEGSVKINIIKERRSYHQNGEVSLGHTTVHSNATKARQTIAHELGHHLEHSNPAAREQAVKFYERRTRGENERALSSLTRNEGYHSSEMAKSDNFIHPYMGKVYRDSSGTIRATEVISMGIEHFLKDPKGFAKQDPDYFDFIYNTLRGKW